MAVNIYKRPLKWWQEATEEPIGARLTENYTGEAIKPGSDGRNVPSVTKQYVKKGGDGLGSEKLAISEKGKAKKALKEEDDLDDMESPETADFNDEGDLPAELGDEGLGDEGDFEDEGAEGDVDIDDIQISIGGKSYSLVPAADEEGLEDEGFEDEGDLGDEGDLEEEPAEDEIGDEDEDFAEAVKRVRARLLKERKARLAKKALKEEDMDSDLYDWTSDLEDEGGMVESKKNPKAKKEAIDTLGGKKLAMDAGQSGSKKSLGAADFGLEGGNEFDAPRTQGSPNKTQAYKPSASSGKYGEKAKALFLKKKLEAKRAAKAKKVLEDLDPFEQEDVMSKKELDDLANLPYDVGAEEKTIEVYEKVKARRAERASKLGESVQPKAEQKLNFAKLLKEGFGRDSLSGI